MSDCLRVYGSSDKYTCDPETREYNSEYSFIALVYDSKGNVVHQYLFPRPDECASLSHEPNPITGAVGSTNEDDCSCASGWISGGGVPGENTYDCVIPSQQPEECYENGQIYDPGRGYCVLDCPSGQLNGVCLEDTADNSETCDKNSPDFQGSIGMGNKKQNICESERTCEGGSLGIVNDIQVCVPDEYGPPTCPSDGVLVMDEYGYVCESMNDVPEEPQTPEEPNTDTDGDGEPDEYRPENDPNSTDKAVDGVSDRIDKTNEAIDQSNQRLDKINKSLDGIGKDLNTGLGAVNDNLKSIEDGMKPPPGGFNPDGFGGLVPTFTETATQLANELATIPAVTAVSGLTSLPQSTTCPIYTIPATPISGPIVMDIHCQVFGDYRGVISALFLFFWSGTALFLFLRA